MKIEYEATFENVEKGKTRTLLKDAGAKLMRSEFLNKRVVLDLPKGHEVPGAWIRILDNGKKVTQTLKIIKEDSKIEDQGELEMEVENLADAVEIFKRIGCAKKSYQENKRELWEMDGVEITIDEWPFLEPFVEVEGKSEKDVRLVCEKLGFNWSKAIFSGIGHLYCRKYDISIDDFHDRAPKLTFGMKNPF